MANIKDLALVKLVGSIFKKGKDKIAATLKEGEVDSDLENQVININKSVAKDEKSQSQDRDTQLDNRESEAVKKSSKEVEKEVEKTPNNPDNKDKDSTKRGSTKKVEKSSKKAKVKDKETKKESSTKKSTKKDEAPGSKKAAKIALYSKDLKKYYEKVDQEFLEVVVKNLGPSIYRKDAELVSCSDSKELETVRKNFLIKKLGFNKSENEMLDGEIKKVCELMKDSKNKYRATFYYILAKNLKKESALS